MRVVEEVNHPSRYDGSCSIECISFMELLVGWEGVVHFCICNAVKYLWRYKNKNGMEDLKKAQWYVNYVLRDNKDTKFTPESMLTMLEQINDLLITECDKIANDI